MPWQVKRLQTFLSFSSAIGMLRYERLNQTLPKNANHWRVRFDYITLLKVFRYFDAYLQVLIKLIVFLGEQFKLLAILFENTNIVLVSHMWRLLEYFISILFHLRHHFEVARIKKFFEAVDFKYIWGVGLILFILVSCDPQEFFLEFCLGSLARVLRIGLLLVLSVLSMYLILLVALKLSIVELKLTYASFDSLVLILYGAMVLLLLPEFPLIHWYDTSVHFLRRQDLYSFSSCRVQERSTSFEFLCSSQNGIFISFCQNLTRLEWALLIVLLTLWSSSMLIVVWSIWSSLSKLRFLFFIRILLGHLLEQNRRVVVWSSSCLDYLHRCRSKSGCHWNRSSHYCIFIVHWQLSDLVQDTVIFLVSYSFFGINRTCIDFEAIEVNLMIGLLILILVVIISTQHG